MSGETRGTSLSRRLRSGRSRLNRQAPVAFYPGGNNPEVRGFQRFFMILGIICGFGFYFIPGLFALRSYRRWQRGEIGPPSGWMYFGGVWVFLLVVAFLGLAYSSGP